MRAIALSALAGVLVACTPEADSYRVAVIRYQHETCTFCPGGDTEIEDWTRVRDVLRGDEVLTSSSYISGFAQQAGEFDDMELVGITSPYQVFGGSALVHGSRW